MMYEELILVVERYNTETSGEDCIEEILENIKGGVWND